MGITWKWLGKLLFGKLHKRIDSLTEKDLLEIVDYVNKVIPGEKKVVGIKSIKIIVEIAQAILDKVTL